MKNKKLLMLAVALASGIFPVQAQVLTEVTVNLLSKLSKSDGDGSGQFNISFGSLDGGLASLLSKGSSADGAAGFATWYGNNSRALVSWNGVTGSSIEDTDSFYRYYGADTSVETWAGGPLTSIFSNSLDNRALAFVTYSNAGVVEEVGLYDLGFNWGNPADTAAYPVGVYDIFTLASNLVTAVYGSTDNAVGINGTIYTSTVPEPSSASLMLLGAAGMLVLRRLRRSNV